LLAAALVVGCLGGLVGLKLGQAIDDSKSDEKNADVPLQQNLLEPKQMNKISQTYGLIKENYLEDVDDEELIEGAIQGMLQTLEDPFSSYMDAETMEQFNEQIESSFEGIGAEVSMVNGVVTIVSPIKDSPAEEAGLRPNDQILSVDNESVAGLDLQEAVDKIRGKRGSEVDLEIKRPGVSEPFTVTLVREEIPVETVYADVHADGKRKTGILEITSFSEQTAEEFSKQLEKLEKKGIDGLIIDVRGNPGGVLETVEDVLKQFIPKDIPYIKIANKQGHKTPYYSDLQENKDYPISGLIDEGSASASENLAVALKEAGDDVGVRTCNREGTVKEAIPINEDGSSIKMTFYKWLSPKGNWINEKGVEPTIEVDQPEYYYTTPADIEEPLVYDDTGDRVKNIQVMLDGLGYDTERTDGYFNRATEEAVKAFQSEHDLEVTGEVDAKTAGLIESKVIEKVRNG